MDHRFKQKKYSLPMDGSIQVLACLAYESVIPLVTFILPHKFQLSFLTQLCMTERFFLNIPMQKSNPNVAPSYPGELKTCYHCFNNS